MDIWQQLEQDISAATNRCFTIQNRHSVSGGDVNQAFCLSGGNSRSFARYFVKLNNANLYEMFVQEANGLAELAKCTEMAVPTVIACGAHLQYSYLILEYLEFAQRCDQHAFGKALANMHLISAAQFGFAQNNFIGRTLQINRQTLNWGEFFTQCRLKPQLDILRSQGHGAKWMDDFEHQFDDVAEFLNQHQPQASLLHGDLWQGNYGNLSDGRPTVYDPAVYYGDSETDLAMMTLFGSPSERFYHAYQQIKPIASGFEQRRSTYNLYHILNHANLFGASYLHQAEHMAKAALEVIVAT